MSLNKCHRFRAPFLGVSHGNGGSDGYAGEAAFAHSELPAIEVLCVVAQGHRSSRGVQ